MNIPSLRLANQHLSRPDFGQPEEVVSWFGAVQAQDYAGAKWALGLRLAGATEGIVERAFAEGKILRTHVLRPTWHFVAPEDIRWMLKLTSPRVHARNALYYRRLELESADFKRCEVALAKALQGGKFLTRAQMRGVLERAGIRGVDARFTLLIM
ncbi:MAG TPA: crosslink repair DNA glycosylase YcaQ family protein, partial [Anaerolineales bacterium]